MSISLMKTKTLSIPGLKIACKLWGDPKNPPILALHGWLDNANSFDPIAELLQKDYYFIAVDLPGHGHSSHAPEGSNYHFTDGIFILVHIMDALKMDKIHLLGHSLGASLASLVAGVAPNRLLSLSLIEGLGPFSHPEHTACEQLSNYLTYLRQKEYKPPKGYDKLESAALARAIKGYVSLDIAKKLVERSLIEKKGMHYWRHDNRLLVPSPLRLTEGQILSCLQAITVHTYLIWGTEGLTFDSKILGRRVNAVKQLELDRIQGGHHLHMEHPKIVADLLNRFYLKH